VCCVQRDSSLTLYPMAVGKEKYKMNVDVVFSDCLTSFMFLFSLVC